MLDKDQYNQDEYNDYYQQEIQGAETTEGENDESSGKKGTILIVLGLIIAAIAGYFGYKSLNPTENHSTSEESLVIQKDTAVSEGTKETIKEENQSKVTVEPSTTKVEEIPEKELLKTQTTVEKAEDKNINQSGNITTSINTEDEQKMSPEEIAKVVQMVMSQMSTQTEKSETTVTTKEENQSRSEDKNLLSALSGTDVDSVKSEDEDKKLEASLDNIKEKTKDSNIKKESSVVDTYNKVKIEENHTGDDELSKLSSQISTLISDKKSANQTNNSIKEKTYTESLKKEIVTRKNEMRIIVVRKGDTLGKIAQRAYGNMMEFKKIYKANPDILKRPDRIYIGQKLRIPK